MNIYKQSTIHRLGPNLSTVYLFPSSFSYFIITLFFFCLCVYEYTCVLYCIRTSSKKWRVICSSLKHTPIDSCMRNIRDMFVCIKKKNTNRSRRSKVFCLFYYFCFPFIFLFIMVNSNLFQNSYPFLSPDYSTLSVSLSVK